MKATVTLCLLLVISGLVAGRNLRQNKLGSATYDTDYPVDDEVDNDYEESARFDQRQYFDSPLAEENDPGSAY